jgi:hypothetical protein
VPKPQGRCLGNTGAWRAFPEAPRWQGLLQRWQGGFSNAGGGQGAALCSAGCSGWWSRPVAMAAAAECDSLAGFICAVAKAPPTEAEEWMEGARKFFHANHDPHRKSASSYASLPSSRLWGLLVTVQSARHKQRMLSRRIIPSPGDALRAEPREFSPRGVVEVPMC